MESLYRLARKSVVIYTRYTKIKELHKYLPRSIVNDIEENYWEDVIDLITPIELLPLGENEDASTVFVEREYNLVLSNNYYTINDNYYYCNYYYCKHICCRHCVVNELQQHLTVGIDVLTVRNLTTRDNLDFRRCQRCNMIIKYEAYDGKDIKDLTLFALEHGTNEMTFDYPFHFPPDGYHRRIWNSYNNVR